VIYFRLTRLGFVLPWVLHDKPAAQLIQPVGVRNPGWHAFFDQDAAMAEATRRKVYDMLATEKMMVQGFHYPFPSVAYIEKTATGYRETPAPWNPTI
jgi:hypothetical protein